MSASPFISDRVRVVVSPTKRYSRPGILGLPR